MNRTESIPAAYLPADDLFVGLVAVSSKSVATIHHPVRGLCTVPCADLRDAPGEWYNVPADAERNADDVVILTPIRYVFFSDPDDGSDVREA